MMWTQTPTTAEAAAQLLADLATTGEPFEQLAYGPAGDQVVAGYAPIVPNRPAEPGDTLWDTITRTHNGIVLTRAPAVEQRGNRGTRAAAAARWARMREVTGSELPPVLWAPDPLPAVVFGGQLRQYPSLGELSNGSASLAPHPAQSAARARLSVLGDPTGAPATPEGSWALTVTILGARQTAEHLSTWAKSLPTRQASQARAESAFYTQHAAAAEEQLPASFTWLDDVPDPARATEAPTVPAVVRVHLGST